MPKFKVPHTLVLLFGMCVFAFVLTRVLPQGRYERTDVSGHEVVVADSYQRVDPEDETVSRLAFSALLTSIPKGFAEAQDIIFFIFLIGGCFGVFRATGAADAGIAALLRWLGHRPSWLIAGAIIVFAVGSSTIGMAEEYIPFIPVLIVMCLGLKLDSLTAVAIVCVGMGVGYGSAAINPFTVLVAQGVAELQPMSGLWFRLLIFPVFLAVGIHHVLRYSKRVLDDPKASFVADVEHDFEGPKESVELKTQHIVVLLALLGAIAWLVWGIKEYGWYFTEMGAMFLGLTIVIAIICRMGPNDVAEKFCFGAAELTTTALLVGVARTVKVILDDGVVIDTIIHAVATPLGELGPYASAVGMLAVQALCNFFIPSGSGQAYVTMPVMTPIADLVGVSRQVAVLAYQFGDGFTNIVVPTNAVLIGMLTIARVPYDRWLRFIIPLMFKMGLVALAAILLAVALGY